MEMIIGNQYDVIVGETMSGEFEDDLMTLKDIKSYKGKEVYIFEDSMMYKFVTYNHDDKIDWIFMDEINNEFDGYSN